ncbi:MAG: bifunctional phosphopantothenoylcysteine decarboxylase/phosphopantothenate--cysteine ligase CoaBC [Mariprofundaceae bacterium]|nr:bifunctional phosphopantothenoylcysteine decarboxylase/phosphopantothenate--cysteine ligase CoaBC [Mariprofundaceae bacterium]
MFSRKRILLAIGGGIAAYRSAELARLLIKQGAEVRTVMTRSACQFITPMTMEALTGEVAHTDMFDLTAEREMGHIQLARWADVLLVAPATADLIGKFTHGICDNLLTTLFQARRGPVLLAPAMNVAMWQATATQHNMQQLQEQGVHRIGPADGELACGEIGPGRMSEPESIVAALAPLLVEQQLSGQHWVINAGPTWEAWDGVRILSNRASGRFGVLLADAAAVRGARVTLIAGPHAPQNRQPMDRIDVISAHDMLKNCQQSASGADVFVATAAVGDYRFAEHLTGKLKRGDDNREITVRLVENTDIVAHIAAMQGRPKLVIAFAAEAEAHVGSARGKMLKKGVDAIFTNDISRMGNDEGAGWWLVGDSVEQAECMHKAQLAVWLLTRIRKLQTEDTSEGETA